jgi:hypothetical protein
MVCALQYMNGLVVHVTLQQQAHCVTMTPSYCALPCIVCMVYQVDSISLGRRQGPKASKLNDYSI